ncbi:MAG TPA: LysE family transporter [Thermoflexia bacterium]|nr:LysE family transporter [Thermoflexia bacterium]
MNVIFQAITLGITAALLPGTLQTFLIAETLRHGWRCGLRVACSPLLSDALIVPLVLLVLGRLPDWGLDALRLAGGGSALFLARGVWQAWRQGTTVKPDAAPSRSLLQGALVNLLGPGPYLFWATLAGPLFLEAYRQALLLAGGFLLGFYTGFVGAGAVLAVLFHRAGAASPRLTRALLGLCAGLLLLFALGLLWEGLHGLMGR